MEDVITQPDGTQVANFEFAFTLDGKAVTTEQEDGSLIIEGLAADFGLDRQDEAFEPGAFEAGIKSFMETNPILLYHHKYDTALGRVLEANIIPAGLHVKALVDAPEPGTIIADYVRKIRAGTLKAFSVGGRFFRRQTPNGPRIFKCDMAELSITPLPVNPRTLFAVAGKAFETAPEAEEEIDVTDFDERLARIDAALAHAEKEYAKEGKAVAPGQLKRIPAGEGHPDAGHVALLLMHQQKIHTLAENVKQNAADPEVSKVAEAAARSAKQHSAKLHQVAARIGPLPDYYGPLA